MSLRPSALPAADPDGPEAARGLRLGGSPVPGRWLLGVDSGAPASAPLAGLREGGMGGAVGTLDPGRPFLVRGLAWETLEVDLETGATLGRSPGWSPAGVDQPADLLLDRRGRPGRWSADGPRPFATTGPTGRGVGREPRS